MKLTKKLTSLLLAIVMCLSLGVPALAANRDNVNRDIAYDWALSVGYPADLLDSLNDEVLLDVYRANKSAENIEVSYKRWLLLYDWKPSYTWEY